MNTATQQCYLQNDKQPIVIQIMTHDRDHNRLLVTHVLQRSWYAHNASQKDLFMLRSFAII
jgi:hypothetical protein